MQHALFSLCVKSKHLILYTHGNLFLIPVLVLAMVKQLTIVNWNFDNILYVIKTKHALFKFHLGYITTREIFLILKKCSYSMLWSSWERSHSKYFTDYRPNTFVSTIRFCSCGAETRSIICVYMEKLEMVLKGLDLL